MPKNQKSFLSKLKNSKKRKTSNKFNPLEWSSRLRVFIVVVVFAVVGTVFLVRSQASTFISQNFSSSSQASEFSVIKGGTWSIANGTYNLTNASKASDIINSNIAVHKNAVKSGDYTLTADAKSTATSSKWDDFTVIFSFTDINNYYYASFNESNDSNTNGIFKVSGDKATQLKDFSSTIRGGTTYKIKIEKKGTDAKVYMGRALMGTISDAVLAGGKVGFGSYNNNATFDNLEVNIPSSIPAPVPVPAPAPVPTPPTPIPAPGPVTYTCTKTLAAGGNLKSFVDSLGAGQTGCLRAGTYGGSDVYLKKPDVTLASYPGEKATITAFVEVYPEATRSRLTRLKFDGGNNSGNTVTLKIQANDAILSDSEVTKGGKGICTLIGSWNAAERVIVERNRIYNCGPSTSKFDHQLYLGKAKGTIIRYNLLSANAGGWGVHLYPSAQGTLVEHNIIDGNHGGVIFAGEGSGTPSSNNTVRFNAITYSGPRWNAEGSWSDGPVGSGNTVTQNCLFTTGPNAPGGLNTASRGFTESNNTILSGSPYINRAAGDYRFSPGSVCANLVGDVAGQLSF